MKNKYTQRIKEQKETIINAAHFMGYEYNRFKNIIYGKVEMPDSFLKSFNDFLKHAENTRKRKRELYLRKISENNRLREKNRKYNK